VAGGLGVTRLLRQPAGQLFVARVAGAEHDAVPGGQQPWRNGSGDDPAISPIERAGFRMLGIKQVMYLRVASAD
jgi:hypothetical protein